MHHHTLYTLIPIICKDFVFGRLCGTGTSLRLSATTGRGIKEPEVTVRLLIALLAISSAPALAQLAPPFPYPRPAPTDIVKNTHGGVALGVSPTNEVYRYVADINVSFDFGSWHKYKFNFGGGILTLIRSGCADGNDFQPDRFRGTVEPAIYLPSDHSAYIFSIRHQSYHSIDRTQDPVGGKESYELYNLAYQTAGSPNLRFSIGKYANVQHCDYSWDFLAQADTVCLGYCRAGKFYISGTVQFVTETGENESNRDNFFDYSLEVGIEAKSAIRYYLAYNQIHDIDKFDGKTEIGPLVGVKIYW